MACVPGLAAIESRLSPISDATYMVQELNRINLWARFSDLDTVEYGHLQDRKRLYWKSARLPRSLWEQATEWDHNLLTVFKLTPWQFDAEDFLTHDNDRRKAEAEACGFPVLSDFGQKGAAAGGKEAGGFRPTGSAKEGGGDWDIEHLHKCRANNLQWPFDCETFDTPIKIHFAGLRDRECEVAVMIDIFWPPDKVPGGRKPIETMDVNAATSRVFKQHLHDDTKVVKTPKEHVQTSAWGPWRQGLCTQIGSGKILIRYFDQGAFHIRLVEPLEAMRLIGWSDEFWEVPDVRKGAEDLDLLHNLAGHAFCFAHYLPVLCATISTFGRFGVEDSSGTDDGAAGAAPGNAGNDGDELLQDGDTSLPTTPSSS